MSDTDLAFIHGLMSAVMADIGAVAKGDNNSQQGYSFRWIDRVMNAVHAAMIKHRVTVTPPLVGPRAGRPRCSSRTRRVLRRPRSVWWSTTGPPSGCLRSPSQVE